jgi:hypothetical protein
MPAFLAHDENKGGREMKLQTLIAAGLLVVISFVMLSQETRNKPDNADKKVEMLFVQSTRSATVSNGKLTLKGVSPTTVFFSDRPERIAGHVTTDEMIPLWSEGKDSFLKDPPNATLSSFDKDGKVSNVVLELRNPKLAGDTMTYDVRIIQGTPENTEAASLFIDVIGMPLTPLSFAGAARRARRRAILY